MTGPGRSDQSSTSPESRMASVSATASSRRHAVEEDRHGEGRDLAFGHRCPSAMPPTKAAISSRRERLAVALLADDFLRQHRSISGRTVTMASRRVGRRCGKRRSVIEAALRATRASAPGQLPPPSGATSLVSWCESSPPVMPAPRLVMTEQAATRRPRKRARMTSGTVDMPTASAPIMRAMRISAGVSKDGPENHM